VSNKREQRLRRKAKAALRATERMAAQQLGDLTKLRIIAHAAIRYVAEIDAPNPHEPWAIANRRDELRDVVHAHQRKPQRGMRRDPQAVRAPAPIAPVATVPKPAVHVHVPAAVAPRVMSERHPGREQLLRDLEVKRAELHNAAKRLGAEANKRHRDVHRVAELGDALDAASKAFAAAEARASGRRAA